MKGVARPGTFKSGGDARRNNKGCPKGAHHIGRPADEFRELCGEAFQDVQALALVKSMIAGDMPAKPETRLEAVKTLKEWWLGKEKQELQHSGDIGSRLIFVHPESK